MPYRGGDIRVRRTSQGYIAVLRIAGPDGVGYEFRGHCGFDEAARILEASGIDVSGPPEVGFSFAGIARAIGSAASAVAKSRVFQQITSVAGKLPPPIGTVATMARQAANTIAGMAGGSQQARQAWEASAALARANPQSPRAVAMRLAMQAAGRPAMGRVAPPPPVPPPPPPGSPAPATAAQLVQAAASVPSPDARPEETLPGPAGSSPNGPGSDSWPFSADELATFVSGVVAGEIAEMAGDRE